MTTHGSVMQNTLYSLHSKTIANKQIKRENKRENGIKKACSS
jgi:hypothetical protein